MSSRVILYFVLGLACLGTGGFLTYGLQYVTVNRAWYIGYMIVAYLWVLPCLYWAVKSIGRKR